jgi:hypothetical protein
VTLNLNSTQISLTHNVGSNIYVVFVIINYELLHILGKGGTIRS